MSVLDAAGIHNVYLAHMLTPVIDGHQVTMGQWPEHLTLVSNFFTASAPDELLQEVARIGASCAPLSLRGVQEARFGDASEYKVLLLEKSAELLELHILLVQLVERHGRFEDARYSGPNYQPHITLQPQSALKVGAEFTIDSITLFDIDRANAVRRAVGTLQFKGTM